MEQGCPKFSSLGKINFLPHHGGWDVCQLGSFMRLAFGQRLQPVPKSRTSTLSLSPLKLGHTLIYFPSACFSTPSHHLEAHCPVVTSYLNAYDL
jgi:hypothetical protein